MSNYGRTGAGTTTPTIARNVELDTAGLGLLDDNNAGVGMDGSDGQHGRKGTRPKRKGTVGFGELLLLSTLLVPMATAQTTNCISLKGSKACPAFQSSFIDKTQIGDFPFLQFVGNAEQFDDALGRYIDEGYSKKTYLDRFGCSALELSNTTNLYARFTTSVLCSRIIQASKASCALTKEQSGALCAEDCGSWAMSEQIIVSDTNTCGNSSEAATDQIRSDFTICAIPIASLSGDCISATSNEANLCGFRENLPGFCYYCQKQQKSLESTDTCCYKANAETVCKGVELPNVDNLPPLPLDTPASDPTSSKPKSDGLSKGALAGIIIGSVAAAALLAILAFLLWRRKKAQQVFVPQTSPRARSSGRSRAASMTFVPQTSGSASRGYEVLPGSRVARMSALEHQPTSSDTASPPPLPTGPSARRRRDNNSSSSDFGLDGDSPTSTERQRYAAELHRPLHPPPRDRNASLSSASIMLSDIYPSSPVPDEKAYSPSGQEQLPFFKDYYSQSNIYTGDKVAVLWPYEPKATDEFGLERGDVLEIVGIWDDGWATGIKLDQTPEEVIERKRQQRDSGVSGRRASPPPRDSTIKAFPLVCVCIPETWAQTIESEEQAQYDRQSVAPSTPDTNQFGSISSSPPARMPSKPSARFKDDLGAR